jgi:hypothetical protein
MRINYHRRPFARRAHPVRHNDGPDQIIGATRANDVILHVRLRHVAGGARETRVVFRPFADELSELSVGGVRAADPLGQGGSHEFVQIAV